MKLRWIEVDHTLRESINYKDMSFPVDIWTDVYNEFVDSSLNCHWHDAFEYGVMLSGELDYYINGEHMKLREGDGVFINSNTMHMATQCKDCNDAVMFTLVFPASLFTDGTRGSIFQKYFKPILGKPIHGFKIENSPCGKRIISTLKEIYSLRDTDFGYELRCLSLLSMVWKDTLECVAKQSDEMIIGSDNRKHEKKMKDILSFIHKHYAENISIDDIARYANISRSECFRCFRRFTNKKPVAYINEYRLSCAVIMLKETNYTISEICAACGFSNSSYFGKLFKQKYAVSPGKYRCTVP